MAGGRVTTQFTDAAALLTTTKARVTTQFTDAAALLTTTKARVTSMVVDVVAGPKLSRPPAWLGHGPWLGGGIRRIT